MMPNDIENKMKWVWLLSHGTLRFYTKAGKEGDTNRMASVDCQCQ
jgi:hypothetical protein